MLKKTFLTFVFLTLLTTFYGLNANFDPYGNRTAGSFIGSAERTEIAHTISVYDELIRSVSEEEGYDWRLMSAIAYHESRFSPDIVSKRGAAGLMQIMPAVARQFNVTATGSSIRRPTSGWRHRCSRRSTPDCVSRPARRTTTG